MTQDWSSVLIVTSPSVFVTLICLPDCASQRLAWSCSTVQRISVMVLSCSHAGLVWWLYEIVRALFCSNTVTFFSFSGQQHLGESHPFTVTMKEETATSTMLRNNFISSAEALDGSGVKVRMLLSCDGERSYYYWSIET